MNLSSKKTARIKGNKFINIRAIAFLVIIIFIFSAAWGETVTEQLKGSIDRIIEVLNDSSLKAPDKKNERIDSLRKSVKEMFDEKEIARRALGVHWKKRTDEEKQEFVKVFNKLLERTYFGKIDAYLEKAGSFSGEDIIYLNETVGERYAVVETRVKIDKDTEIPVHYQLKNRQCRWLVCDIAIEGVSIVKNYRVQFSEILADSSFEDLIAKLKSKEQENQT